MYNSEEVVARGQAKAHGGLPFRAYFEGFNIKFWTHNGSDISWKQWRNRNGESLRQLIHRIIDNQTNSIDCIEIQTEAGPPALAIKPDISLVLVHSQERTFLYEIHQLDGS